MIKIQIILVIAIAVLSCNSNRNKIEDIEEDLNFNAWLLASDSLENYTENRYNILMKKGATDQFPSQDSFMRMVNEIFSDQNGYWLEKDRHELEVVQNMDDQEFLLYYEYKRSLMLEYELRSN